MRGRIDVHAHMIPTFYQDAVYAAGTGPAIGRYPQWSAASALETMDKHGIATALLSVAQPGVTFTVGQDAASLARRCNEFAADLARLHPQRFGSFLTVPMDSIDHAVAEIEYGLDTLHADGVCLFASIADKFLGDEQFDPVLQLLNERHAAVFVHPAYHPSSRSLDLPWPGFMIEYVFDTTRAAVNLLFSGALQRFADIKFILSHGGGTIPYLAWRLTVSPRIDPRLPMMTEGEIMDGLAHFYYDTALTVGPQADAALAATADPSHILFGSDWPFANSQIVGDGIRRGERFRQTTGKQPGQLRAHERQRVMTDNAAALFPRFATLTR